VRERQTQRKRRRKTTMPRRGLQRWLRKELEELLKRRQTLLKRHCDSYDDQTRSATHLHWKLQAQQQLKPA
jgi:hypothetical protein